MPPFSTRCGGGFDQLLRARMQLTRLFLHEQRDRHAPGTLARDTPVRAILDHAGDTLLAPLRRPLRPLDVAQRMLAQALLLHADEPLRRSAEDHRRLVPPAMRIAVSERLVVNQAPTLLQRRDDDGIGLLDFQAGDQRRARVEAAVIPYRIRDRAGCNAAQRRSPHGRARARCARHPYPHRASRARRG